MNIIDSILRIFRILGAALYLFIAWIWGLLLAAADVILRAPIVKQLQENLRKWTATAPIYFVFALFLIPLLIREAIKLVALDLGMRHHFWMAIAAYIFAEIFGFVVVAAIYEICSDRLMQLPWFARLYHGFIRAKNWAHALIAPFVAEARRLGRQMKAWAHETYRRYFAGKNS